jgi:N-acetylglutamate synthase/N-acetylornithine aminotransferase
MRENDVVDLMEATERLEAVAEALEEAASRLAADRVVEAQEHVGRIVATVESAREAELERKLAEAEARIVALTAAAAGLPQAAGRKTLPVGMASMLAKQGVSLEVGDGVVSLEAGAIDGALASLSIEQRIAVKSELRRAGLLA